MSTTTAPTSTTEEALAQARANGCRGFPTAQEAVQGAEAVVSMLPNGGIVERVFTQDVIGHAPAGAILIDCSTIDVATARKVAQLAEQGGYEMVDSPVSGGIAAAKAGTLTFMVGGSEQAFQRTKAVLEDMGKAVIHAGESGAGQAAKICNNMLLGIHMVGTCEAFAMAEKLGLDPQKFYDIASVSSGQCWSMTSYCPVAGVGPDSPADHGYHGGFSTALMLKDLKLAMEAADIAGTDPSMGRRAKELYEAFDAAGNSPLDFSAIFNSIK